MAGLGGGGGGVIRSFLARPGKPLRLEQTLYCILFSFQSTAGFVFAIMGVMSALTGGVVINVVQNLFPEGRY